MLIGNPKSFAYEWKLDAEPCGHYMLGHVRMWIDGIPYGRWDEFTCLGDVLSSSTYPVGDCGNRASERFCAIASGKELADVLNSGLFYGGDNLGPVLEQEKWARFNVTLNVDVLDGIRLYLVDCPSHSRLLLSLWKPEMDIYQFEKEKMMILGEYDAVISAFQQSLLECEASLLPHREA